MVQEDTAIDWSRSDYDPYARTKKFCEHMVRQLLARCSADHFSPQHRAGRQPPRRNKPIRHGARVCVSLPDFRRFPSGPTDRIDIVPVDFVADSVVKLHQKENPAHEIYHLSSGREIRKLSFS